MRTVPLAVALSLCLAGSAQAEVLRLDQSDIRAPASLPVYEWVDRQVSTRAVALAVHGLTLHGGTFDALGRHLAREGFVVLAPDLRGYGRWYHESDRHPEGRVLDYRRSFDDLVELAGLARERHPGLPLFVIGESMGADIALRLASRHPELVDGLVLSSPAIKRRRLYLPHSFYDAAGLVTNLRKQFDMQPYIRHCASEDPRVSQEILEDPLIRRRLSPGELIHSLRTMRATLGYVKEIPPSIPVLVIQGNADRALKTNGVVLLLSKLRSVDQTVKWFPDRGHILLETSHLQPDTLAAVEGWLSQQLQREGDYATSLSELRSYFRPYRQSGP